MGHGRSGEGLEPPRSSPEALALARAQVRDLLGSSEAFRALSPEQQREIAKNTVDVATYLAEPEGVRTGALPRELVGDPYAQPLADGITASTPRRDQFVAQGAREGAAVAGALLEAVNFPDFVSGLIKGVFHAIVRSSIEQMEAYGKLVADVAKTLNQFRDDNVTVNQGRDHVVDTFPDVFFIDVEVDDDGLEQPHTRLREDADPDDVLRRVKEAFPGLERLSSVEDDTIESTVVPAARTQLASSRQQLLATMVLMGINRIVVTDGKISAKVMYDFRARDTFRSSTHATDFEYGDQYRYASAGDYESQYGGGSTTSSRDKEGGWSQDRQDASSYAKGTYKSSAEPVMTLMSVTSTQTDANLDTKAQLAGVVDINFRSDFLPLERMADSFQIGRIQDAAQPRSSTPATSGQGAAPASATPAASATTPAPPSGTPGTTP